MKDVRTARFPNVPFDPRRAPFFYGWVILGVGTLGILMSVPGQTIGVSVFTDYLIDALAIPRTTLSLAYLVGTISSALILSYAGTLYDRYGARRVAAGASLLLGATLVYLSQVDRLSATVRGDFPASGAVVIAFFAVAIGFFLLRFSGQGVLTLVSRNMVMKWFDRRRGLVNGVLGVAIAFGFSYSPRILDGLIHQSGWRGAWLLLALACGAGFPILVFVLYRDDPRDSDLEPDGGAVAHKGRNRHPETTAARDFTRAEAIRTFAFWVFSLTLVMAGLLITALTFHIVDIFAQSGMPRETAVSMFFPASMVAVAVQFLGSWSSDFIKLKYILLGQLAGLILSCASLVFLGTGIGHYGLIVGYGIAQGLFGVTSNVTWPRFYGLKHLGAISGFQAAMMVAGTAVGPYVFSLSRDVTGGYAAAGVISLAILSVLFGCAFRAERPVHAADAGGDAD